MADGIITILSIYLMLKFEGTLNPSQKKSYPRILHRTKKLFYVCCTRAKDNLIVYYPSPSPNVLEGAINLFWGRELCES